MNVRASSIVVLLFLLRCGSRGWCGTHHQNESGVSKVDYCELIASAASLSGKVIQVRGIYSYGFENKVLLGASCCPASGNRPKIWMDIQDLSGDSRRLARKFPKDAGLALATFTGTLQGNGPYGDGRFTYQLVVTHIEHLEATAHPSASHVPEWFPKGCD